LSENAQSIEIDAIPQSICKDPDDARILALAQKSEAAYLITGDKGLLAIKKFGSSKILSPRQFWEAVKKSNES
jgi:predicted nucleic acid-binding protein